MWGRAWGAALVAPAVSQGLAGGRGGWRWIHPQALEGVSIDHVERPVDTNHTIKFIGNSHTFLKTG